MTPSGSGAPRPQRVARRWFHPELRSGSSPRVRELRNVVSSVFIAMLIGLAYAELLPPVRQEVRAEGFSFGLFALLAVFFLTSMRFFVGNQLHLLSDDFIRSRGDVWFFDFMFITLETVGLAFLGGVATVSESRGLSIGFFHILVGIYLLDALWIGSQGLGGWLRRGWKRPFVPWPWAVLNLLLAGGIGIVAAVGGELYTPSALAWILGLHVVGFGVDLFLIDAYDFL